MKIKVAIADDHPLVINGLQLILSKCNDMEITGSYSNGAELLHGIALTQPDVLLLDIQMPGQTGDELAEIIKAKYPDVKMLVLTNQDNVYYIKNMLRKGVQGYVLKTTSDEILLEAIRAVHSGNSYLQPVLQDKVVKDNLQARTQVSAKPTLSTREKEVLQYIASDLTSQQIADILFVSKRTIDNHRLSLHMKLGVKNVASLVKRAIQLGLIG